MLLNHQQKVSYKKSSLFEYPSLIIPGPLCDILWADPTDGYDNEKIEQRSEMYVHNGPRGCSYNVSYKAICKFLDDNDLLCVIRAHQVQSAGCKMYKKHEKTLFPTLVTIFSAPNYCNLF